MLKTKCVHDCIEADDGIRILVMSRLTLNDGITPDESIRKEKYDFHYKELAPSPKLIGNYYKRGLSWEEFEKRFKKEMEENEYLISVAKSALTENVTLLCIEESPDHCHRRLLAEMCKKLQPKLKLKIA